MPEGRAPLLVRLASRALRRPYNPIEARAVEIGMLVWLALLGVAVGGIISEAVWAEAMGPPFLGGLAVMGGMLWADARALAARRLLDQEWQKGQT